MQWNGDPSALDRPSFLPPVLAHDIVQLSATYILRKATHQASWLEFPTTLGKAMLALTSTKYCFVPIGASVCFLLLLMDARKHVFWSIIGFAAHSVPRLLWDLRSHWYPIFWKLHCRGGYFGVVIGKDGFDKCLSDFGLEVVMQTKQYTRLEAVMDTDWARYSRALRSYRYYIIQFSTCQYQANMRNTLGDIF